MEVLLLAVPGCPHLARARAGVEEALEQTNRDAVILECEVGSQADAQRLGMRGSPTVLVDGEAVGEGDPTPSLSCRLSVPAVEELVAALSR